MKDYSASKDSAGAKKVAMSESVENIYLCANRITDMEIVEVTISRQDLSAMAQGLYGDMIKAVADVDKGLLAVDAELHSDLERMLLDGGSAQGSLWGFNIYPEQDGEDFIEFDSLINIRPRQHNMSRDVENPEIRRMIIDLVKKFVR